MIWSFELSVRDGCVVPDITLTVELERFVIVCSGKLGCLAECCWGLKFSNLQGIIFCVKSYVAHMLWQNS